MRTDWNSSISRDNGYPAELYWPDIAAFLPRAWRSPTLLSYPLTFRICVKVARSSSPRVEPYACPDEVIRHLRNIAHAERHSRFG